MTRINYHLEDTIAAISTSVGPGGIGIVRLSGDKALGIADKMFIGKKAGRPSRFQSHTVHYGWIIDRRKATPAKSKPKGKATQDRDMIDEVLLTVMRQPVSYTREDIVEISCHGGPLVVKTVLSLAVDLGARLAEPGEFTKRAFLNGRINLAQAEAVLDIIQAKTESCLRVSAQQLKGDLTRELETIREILLNIYTALEAALNFPEEDIEEQRKTRTQKRAGREHKTRDQLASARKQVGQLLETADQGRLLREGIRIVICGKPNVGKSSLLNVLLKQPRAIVTAIAGTTRDTIEEVMLLDGIPFQVVDTAGILQPRDQVEQEAIRRSQLHIQQADLVLLLVDGSSALSSQDIALMEAVRQQNMILVVNKTDLKDVITKQDLAKVLPGKRVVRISALKRTGVRALEKTIVNTALKGKAMDTSRLTVSNLRHVAALKECEQAMTRALDIMEEGLSGEFVSEEIKLAIQALDKITGRYLDQDLVEQIFSAFCIGK